MRAGTAASQTGSPVPAAPLPVSCSSARRAGRRGSGGDLDPGPAVQVCIAVHHPPVPQLTVPDPEQDWGETRPRRPAPPRPARATAGPHLRVSPGLCVRPTMFSLPGAPVGSGLLARRDPTVRHRGAVRIQQGWTLDTDITQPPFLSGKIFD